MPTADELKLMSGSQPNTQREMGFSCEQEAWNSSSIVSVHLCKYFICARSAQRRSVCNAAYFSWDRRKRLSSIFGMTGIRMKHWEHRLLLDTRHSLSLMAAAKNKQKKKENSFRTLKKAWTNKIFISINLQYLWRKCPIPKSIEKTSDLTSQANRAVDSLLLSLVPSNTVKVFWFFLVRKIFCLVSSESCSLHIEGLVDQ